MACALHASDLWHVFCPDRPRLLSRTLSLGIAFLPSRRHPIVYHLRMPSINYRTRFPKLAACALAFAFAIAASAQNGHHITTAKEALGFDVGDDYHLANYAQFTAYWQKLAKESDRMKLVEIGKSEEGRPQWMAIVTSPENHKKLARWKEISRKLALGEGLSDDDARKLAAEGKAVVWIDGGLHASEVLGAQQLMESLYTFLTRTDPETMRILDSVVILFVQANPDGQELVTSSYMTEKEPAKRAYV